MWISNLYRPAEIQGSTFNPRAKFLLRKAYVMYVRNVRNLPRFFGILWIFFLESVRDFFRVFYPSLQPVVISPSWHTDYTHYHLAEYKTSCPTTFWDICYMWNSVHGRCILRNLHIFLRMWGPPRLGGILHIFVHSRRCNKQGRSSVRLPMRKFLDVKELILKWWKAKKSKNQKSVLWVGGY